MDPRHAEDDVIGKRTVHDIESHWQIDIFGESWKYDLVDELLHLVVDANQDYRFLRYVPVTKTHTFENLFEDDVC